MTASTEAFYLPRGEGRFESTELTRGPWNNDFQHGGPPSALIAREVERAIAGSGMTVVRVTVELLKPVPLAPLAVAVAPLKVGRKVQWLSVELSGNGALLAHATAVCMRQAEVPVPKPGDPLHDPVAGPGESEPFRFSFFQHAVGYHTAMELKLARGQFGSGQVSVWMRMRHPLLPDEAPSSLQRVMIAADSGNGVSMALDPRQFLFMNPDLTVYLHRPPAGEWVCLDARTIPQSHGVGLADTRLLDEHGPIGRSLQSLLIEARN